MLTWLLWHLCFVFLVLWVLLLMLLLSVRILLIVLVRMVFCVFCDCSLIVNSLFIRGDGLVVWFCLCCCLVWYGMLVSYCFWLVGLDCVV